MGVISTYSNGNSEAQVTKTVDDMYTVSYLLNNKVIRKSSHVNLEMAESLAEDFVLEHGSGSQLLNE
jgi:hypothetical protein